MWGEGWVQLWMMRKGMKVQFNNIGLIDVAERSVYKVDYLVEAGNTPMFVVWYSSDRRRQDRRLMQGYAEELSNACKRAIGRRVGIILVNMYHSGVEGGITQDPA